jgi:predicted RNA binding protein YcfA (HicA-like mRNA interferase family)
LKSPSDAQAARLTARQIIAALEKVGFFLARQSGSHMIYKNAAGKRVTVPFHALKILHPKVLKSILREADLSLENPQNLL